MLTRIPTRLAGPRQLAALARAAWALATLGVTVLALLPSPPAQADLGWDKLNHTAAFGLLALLARAGFGPRWLMLSAVLLGHGVLIELLQSLSPSRSAEVADVLADAVGIAVGLGLAALMRRLPAVAARASS